MLKHTVTDMIKQRIYGLIAGYEDLNDHKHFSKDILLKLICKKSKNLASPSTLYRLEQMSNPTIKDQDILVTAFIESYNRPPKAICLDFDPTDVVFIQFHHVSTLVDLISKVQISRNISLNYQVVRETVFT